MKANSIRLLIVDDSTLAQRMIAKSLAAFPEIKIVGTAIDPYAARDQIQELNPDVVTLDIEMPRMDGLTFLKLVMKHRPMPVIIMSSLTAAGSQKALEALQAGAVDVMDKAAGARSGPSDGMILAQKIKAAAGAHLRPASGTFSSGVRTSKVHSAPTGGRAFDPRQLILLGASTGGTEALKTLLEAMAEDLPGVCIVQHIPAYFSKAFAQRLNEICPMEVREARHGDIVRPGLALVAPGGYHMLLSWRGTHYAVSLNEGPLIHYQRPAVDILFESAVKAGAGIGTAAALLTGMGVDGSAGLLRLHSAGAATIAQDEASCVVFGMPREAIRLGGARQVLPLERIADRLDELVSVRM